jgi:hypothetical protein
LQTEKTGVVAPDELMDAKQTALKIYRQHPELCRRTIALGKLSDDSPAQAIEMNQKLFSRLGDSPCSVKSIVSGETDVEITARWMESS